MSGMTPLIIGLARREPRHGQPARLPRTASSALSVTRNTRIPRAPPAAVAPFVAALRALPGHVFWKDDRSLIGSDLVNVDQIMTPGQVTDGYLLALAARS